MPSSDGTANLPPVLIIGCGISGLALANALLNHKVPFLVFERDLSLRHRGQGYRFRIQSLGITAIDELCRGAESMGDFELRKRIPLAYTALRPSRKTVDALTAQDIEVTQYNDQWSADAEMTRRMEGIARVRTGTGQRECERSVLREVLLQRVKDHVRFGHYCTGFVKTDDGIQACFEGGIEVSGSLLVGADGYRSRIARQLLGDDRAKVFPSGVATIFGRVPFTEETQGMWSEDFSAAMNYIQDKRNNCTRTMFTQVLHFDHESAKQYDDLRVPPDYYYYSMIFRIETAGLAVADGHPPDSETIKDIVSRFTKLSSPELAQVCYEMTEDWHPSLRAIVKAQDPEACTFAQWVTAHPYDLPHRETDAKVTLIADSIHAIAASAAMGASAALADGVLLGKILAQGWRRATRTLGPRAAGV